MKTCKTCHYHDGQYCDRVDSDSTFEIVVDVLDDSGLTVKLKTSPDFGCVYHREPVDLSCHCCRQNPCVCREQEERCRKMLTED